LTAKRLRQIQIDLAYSGIFAAILALHFTFIQEMTKSFGRQLLDACKACDLAAVQKLLDKGVELNCKDNLGMTALSWASGYGHVQIVKLLIDKGAHIDIESYLGVTALFWACCNRSVECARLLLERGADMSIKNVNGDTAKDFAIRCGYEDIVQLLDEVCMFQTQARCFKYRYS
jgi:ankyrin repeat protein